MKATEQPQLLFHSSFPQLGNFEHLLIYWLTVFIGHRLKNISKCLIRIHYSESPIFLFEIYLMLSHYVKRFE